MQFTNVLRNIRINMRQISHSILIFLSQKPFVEHRAERDVSLEKYNINLSQHLDAIREKMVLPF